MNDDGLRFDCRDVRLCAAAWLDGQLSPAESEFMEEHISQCRQCEELIAQMAEQDLKPPKLRIIQDDEYWREMDETLATELMQAQRASRRKVSWKVLSLYAAALLLTVFWGIHQRHRANALQEIVENQQRTLEQFERMSAQPESPKSYSVPVKYVPSRMDL